MSVQKAHLFSLGRESFSLHKKIKQTTLSYASAYVTCHLLIEIFNTFFFTYNIFLLIDHFFILVLFQALYVFIYWMTFFFFRKYLKLQSVSFAIFVTISVFKPAVAVICGIIFIAWVVHRHGSSMDESNVLS